MSDRTEGAEGRPIFDVDTVLATTRSVRQRLDLDRPVPDQVIFDCIDLAEQAPTGGNLASRRWVVVRDPARKEALAQLYRDAGGQWLIDAADRLAGTGRPNEAVTRSGGYLARNLGRVPAIVIPTIRGTYDGSGQPGLFDSVLQAAWSFCLALRARGLGSAWTTVHLGRGADVAALLGIPEGITQVALLPVAWTIGTGFRSAARRPAHEITYVDAWGSTRGPEGSARVDERDVAAPPERLWEAATARARASGGTVTTEEPIRRLVWAVAAPADSAASVTHRVDLDPLPGRRTRLRYSIAPPVPTADVEVALAELAASAAPATAEREPDTGPV